ncbi:orotate phosphoribosyltransferase [Rubrobacter xylanophilus]|uniref:Orotate phosphoribosyltransferase n=1 Tax=Rubrobacter xylanophilus TaxID=49319 RepID=A0A510HI61_9ACTN|nr:orotate phosphoribosyltransferase [Rubrobacter xylanophilus]BBL79659.1 orotate phosphoribosyltransferase [Rubrobacter xylanophilus]
MDRERLAARIREAALLEGDFVLSSGRRSSLYVDKYLFSTDPRLLQDIAAGLEELLPPGVNRLAGVELGAVPLVVAVALRTGMPYVIVRKEVKGHGTARSLEGRLERGERVALIEDVITTGTQAVRAARRLVEAGAEVGGVVAVIDRREDRGGELEGFPFGALFRMEDLRAAKPVN